MTDPAARRVLTELDADQGWPAEGEELLHRPTVEAAIAAAGFQVARRERIASEWSEYQLEHDLATSPRTCWRSLGSPATATAGGRP